jgi:putative transcriptional regulator
MAHRHEHGHEAGHASSQSSETLDQLIAHYVAGTLPPPMRALVGSHIELKESGRRLAAGFEALAGSELETIAPESVTDRDAKLKAIFASNVPAQGRTAARPQASCRIFPRSLVGFTGYTAENIPWRTKLPGLKEVRFAETDGFQATLYWIRAGRAMPHHTHGGSEVTLVLDGGFSDGLGHYLRGDVAAADETVDHRPVADDDGPCICFAVTTAELKMTGSLRQLFSDIFGR